MNLSLEVFGDKWTLLIIRDMLLHGKKYYHEFLHSAEGIATNILANRLAMLEKEGLIAKRKDEQHKQKYIYTLTEMGIDLLPVVVEMGTWSSKYKAVNTEAKAHIRKIKAGGDEGMRSLKAALKKEHLL